MKELPPGTVSVGATAPTVFQHRGGGDPADAGQGGHGI